MGDEGKVEIAVSTNRVLTRTRTIMHFVGVDGSNAIFSSTKKDDAEEDIRMDWNITDLKMSKRSWHEFGEPREITVTMVPVDELNIPENAI